jgi:hypothetical protein
MEEEVAGRGRSAMFGLCLCRILQVGVEERGREVLDN